MASPRSFKNAGGIGGSGVACEPKVFRMRSKPHDVKATNQVPSEMTFTSKLNASTKDYKPLLAHESVSSPIR